ncbi:unnamed protein product [Caenorhabditis angaria]|uniref:Uncharacterized protein n=1 Tax=Caenorhabditis angaria TaxID=860376 RepID=A0A9P1J0H6_9PELO|nr:unnamed protein product [Caenorhabditis angaria]
MKTVQFSEEDEIVEYPIETIDKSSFHQQLLQQKLPGNTPIIDARIIISLTILFGFTFIGISLIIQHANNEVRLTRLRYDNSTEGYIDFLLDENYAPPIYFYYELKNALRTHRLVNEAMCKNQLLTNSEYSSEQCDPEYPWPSSYSSKYYMCTNELSFKNYANYSIMDKQCAKGESSYYAPMGGLATIMFNDTFRLVRLREFGSEKEVPIHWTENGLVPDSTKNVFGHPENNEDLCDSDMFKNTVKPIGWDKHICEMGGYQNDSFIIWMSKTAYKNFKKAYRILDTSRHPTGLKSGSYRLYVDNNYRYDNMEKYFWILHPSYFGTEMVFLQHLYLIVGLGLVILSIGLVGMQIFLIDRRKKFDDDD